MSRLAPVQVFTSLLAAVVCLLSTGLTAGQNPLNPLKRLMGGDKNTKYQTFKDPAGRFEIQYPEKDWKLLPSGSSSLAVFARNDGPTLFVDHIRLSEPLTPAEVEGMSAVELSTLKEQQPKGKDFKSEPLDSKAGRGVLIRYARDGVSGPETAVQYSVPAGLELFRLNGVIPIQQLSKYEPIIMYMIQSFRSPATAPTSKN